MALNIKNHEVEVLAAEVATLAGESKTEAIRQALKARRDLLRQQGDGSRRAARLLAFLEAEVWPFVPAEVRGKGLSQDEQDDILGYGPEGV